MHQDHKGVTNRCSPACRRGEETRAHRGVSALLVRDSASAGRLASGGPEFEWGAGMHCRRCGTPAPDASRRLEAARSGHWVANRISGLRCAQCGVLLGADDIAQLLGEKESQLAQFGLLSVPADSGPPATSSPARRRAIRLWKD